MTTAQKTKLTDYDIFLQEMRKLKMALDKLGRLIPNNRPAGFYRALHVTLQRHSQEIAGLVEIVDD